MPKSPIKSPSKAKPKAKAKASISTPQDEAQQLLNILGITGTVTTIQEEDILKFQIDTPEPGLLIGFHGETLASFQKILMLALENRTGAWQKISVNVGDYRERREETLRSLAMSTAQRVKFSGQPWPLPSLTASDRRVIHTLLTDHPDVMTESEGEGPNRRLVVKPRSR